MRAGPGQGAVLGLETVLDRGERVERAVERRAVVRGHHAGAQQRAARRDGRVPRRVDEHPGVVELTPEEDAALKKSAAAVKELTDVIKV